MILVVEDHGPSRRAATLTLGTAGYEVMNAGDGTEAQELLSLHHFDLVITDLLMGNLSGLNLINTIRLKMALHPDNSHLRLSLAGAGKAIIDGMSVFLQKPFTPTALIMTVERLLPKSN